MATICIVTAFGDMSAKKGRPKMFINVLPDTSIVKSPKGKENVAAAMLMDRDNRAWWEGS